MTFWDWASQGDNLICLSIVVIAGVALIVALLTGRAEL